MELPTLEEFEKTCAKHLWLFTLEPDLNRAMEGLKTYHYIQDVIKKGGGKYKQVHRKAYEKFIDDTKENADDYGFQRSSN
ncbi:hypothetical protein N8469_00805 [bacterium]|jgi:hypothetical protein|nr:hypothetical protein [bacterium]